MKYSVKRISNWTAEQESAFQEFLKHYKAEGNPVPKLLVMPFRKGMRDRNMTPDQIRKHRGLLI